MARRINVKFLTTLVVVVVVGGAGAVIGSKYLRREKAGPFIAAGKEAMKQQHWLEAAQNLARAAHDSPKDASLQLLLGQALGHLAEDNPSFVIDEGKAYKRALEQDPNNLEALKDASNWSSDMVLRYGDDASKANAFRDAIQYAQRAHAIDPADKDMAARPYILTIQQWMANLQTDQQLVDDAVQKLQDFWQQQPDKAELPFWISLTKVTQGMQTSEKLAQAAQPPEVTALYSDAVKTFEGVLTGPNGGSQDQNASMHFRFAQVLDQLANVDNSSPDNIKTYSDRATNEITRARALVKPDDPNYLNIEDYAATLALRHGNRDAAIQIYKSMPDSSAVRLALVDVMGKGSDTRQEAEELCTRSIDALNDDPAHLVAGGLRWRFLLTLANLKVYDYISTNDPATKKKLGGEIENLIDKLNIAAGNGNPLVLREVEAKYMVNSGQEHQIQAIQSLSKLIADNHDAARDYYLNMALAQALQATGQTAKAMPLLQSVVNLYPRDVNSRKELLGILVTEAPDRAPAQIAELEHLDPGDPVINLYKIQLAENDPAHNQDEISANYKNIPENTPGLQSQKAKLAISIKNYDDAERLLKLRMADTKYPPNAQDYLAYSRLYFIRGDRAQALAIANQGQTAFPDDPQMKLLVPFLKGEDVKDIEKLQMKLDQEDPDKLEGQLALATMARNKGDVDQEEAHLKTAEKIAQSPRVWDQLFQLYITQGKFDLAESYAQKLGDADYDSAGGALYRLSICQAKHDYKGAEAIARQLAQDKPEFARTWLAMGDVMFDEGDYEQAIPQYEQCLEKQTNIVSAYVGLVKCYYALNRPGDAQHVLDDGLSKIPNDPVLHEMRLNHELNYGDPRIAVQELQEEIQQKGDDPSLYGALAELLLRYSAILDGNRQHADSITEAKEAIKVLQPAINRWPDQGRFYAILGDAQMTAEMPDDAIKTMKDWSEMSTFKSSPEPHEKLCQYYERLNQPQNAENEMRTALAKSNYSVDAQINMANLLARHGKFDDALSLLRATNADKPAIREKAITVMIVSGKFDQAQADLQSQLSQTPPPSNSEELYAIWALALLDKQQYQQSIDKSTQALAFNAKDPTALFCRAKARLHLRPPDATGAVADLQLMRQSNPTNMDARLYLADAYIQLNQMDDAAEELRAGLRANPKSKPVRMKLVEVLVNGAHPKLNEAIQLLQEVETVQPFDKDPDIFQAEASLMQQLPDIPGALVKSNQALAMAPNDPNIVNTNFDLQLQSNNAQKVLDTYNTLPDTLKNTYWANWQKAQAEKQVGDPASSLADYKKALASAVDQQNQVELERVVSNMCTVLSYDDAVAALLPLSDKHVEAKISLAHCYQSLGQQDKALAEVDGVMSQLDSLPTNTQINVLASAALLYQLAKPTPLVDKANDAYRRWLKLEPGNLEALNNLACLLADSYKPTRAAEGLTYAQTAVDLTGQVGRTEPRFLDTLAWTKILSGNPQDGVSDLLKATTQFPDFPEEYLHLGEGYMLMLMPNEANSAAKTGLDETDKLGPKQVDPALRTKLQDLLSRSEDEIKKKQNEAQ
jgi:lipopolysaccharide biosynthesis regulator YciM